MNNRETQSSEAKPEQQMAALATNVNAWQGQVGYSGSWGGGDSGSGSGQNNLNSLQMGQSPWSRLQVNPWAGEYVGGVTASWDNDGSYWDVDSVGDAIQAVPAPIYDLAAIALVAFQEAALGIAGVNGVKTFLDYREEKITGKEALFSSFLTVRSLVPAPQAAQLILSLPGLSYDLYNSRR